MEDSAAPSVVVLAQEWCEVLVAVMQTVRALPASTACAVAAVIGAAVVMDAAVVTVEATERQPCYCLSLGSAELTRCLCFPVSQYFLLVI
jgi:hypothetical protein